MRGREGRECQMSDCAGPGGKCDLSSRQTGTDFGDTPSGLDWISAWVTASPADRVPRAWGNCRNDGAALRRSLGQIPPTEALTRARSRQRTRSRGRTLKRVSKAPDPWPRGPRPMAPGPWASASALCPRPWALSPRPWGTFTPTAGRLESAETSQPGAVDRKRPSCRLSFPLAA